jgi:hypothetical protein
MPKKNERNTQKKTKRKKKGKNIENEKTRQKISRSMYMTKTN